MLSKRAPVGPLQQPSDESPGLAIWLIICAIIIIAAVVLWKEYRAHFKRHGILGKDNEPHRKLRYKTTGAAINPDGAKDLVIPVEPGPASVPEATSTDTTQIDVEGQKPTQRFAYWPLSFKIVGVGRVREGKIAKRRRGSNADDAKLRKE